MFRSLHMKLVLIMTLLIVSLMTVVGAFLINSVVSFYLHDFYDKMWEVFSQDTDFVNDLRSATENETNGAERLADILDSYTGTLGVDGRNRNYYVLDGHTAQVLASSDAQSAQKALTVTENLATALNGEDG